MSHVTQECQPLGGLPAADHTVLLEPPLELAVAEIRFFGREEPLGAADGLAARDALAEAGYRFSKMDPVREGRVAIDLRPGAVPQPQVQDSIAGWQFVDPTGHLQVTLMPAAVAVQTARYERWSTSMRPLLEAVLQVAADVARPSGVARIGLRYIDRFVDPGVKSATGWRGRIDDTLLGPVQHPVLGERVKAAQQQLELALGPAQGALLRHGPFVDDAADGAVSYLLDIDVFDAEPSVFDIAHVLARAQVLNRTAFSLFQTSLSQEYLAHLRGPAAPTGEDEIQHNAASRGDE